MSNRIDEFKLRFRQQDYPLHFALALSGQTIYPSDHYPAFAIDDAIDRAETLGDEINTTLRNFNPDSVLESCEANVSGEKPDYQRVILLYSQQGQLISRVSVRVEAENHLDPNPMKFGTVARFDWGFTTGSFEHPDIKKERNFRRTLEALCNQFALRSRLWNDKTGAFGGYALLRGRGADQDYWDEQAWGIAASGIALPKVYLEGGMQGQQGNPQH